MPSNWAQCLQRLQNGNIDLMTTIGYSPELQALDRKPMYMKDWISKLDDFLKISNREILPHAGSVSRDQAMDKARVEYEKFRKQLQDAPSPVEQHFIEAAKKVKDMENQPSPRKTPEEKED